MEVQPFDHQLQVPVVETGFKEITLGFVDVGETEINRQELTGVVWPDGYGQLTEFLESRGTQVRHVFKVVEGEAPSEGDLVAIDEYFWPTDPSVVGLEFDEYGIDGPEGELPMLEFPAGDAEAPWVVLVHGRQARGPSEMFRLVPFLHEAGYNVLIPSYRNDDGAPQVEDRQVEFGLTEWEDLAAAIDYIGAEDTTVIGYSMGGAITLSWMINDPTAANTARAVVLDSPAVDAAEIVRFNAAEITYEFAVGDEKFEFDVPPALTETALFFSRLRFGYDWDAMDYTSRASDLPDTPILVLHGGKDVSVPLSASRAFADAAIRARLVEYPEAAHTRLWNVYPDRYESDILDFLDLHAP